MFVLFYYSQYHGLLIVLDSDGKISSGILRGGLIWPGHYKECNSVYAPLDEEGHGDFYGQYCASSWTLNLNEQVFHSVFLKIPISDSLPQVTRAVELIGKMNISKLIICIS